MDIIIKKTTSPKPKPDGIPAFGTVFTDHMFMMRFSGGQWHSPEIKPYQSFSLEPSAAVFHYGQAIFEGLKAYRNQKGEIRLFRYRDNFERMLLSCQRLCIPPFDIDLVCDALKKLLMLDHDWIPKGEGTSLYIRPTIIAVEKSLSVHSSNEFIFFIILSPVGAYYSGGLAPVKLLIESEYVRSAAQGGTGHRKFAGNYAASLIAGEKAAALKCDQVMWLDGKSLEYIEEVGSMNIFFVLNGKVVTPELNGSILPGITRMSIIQLLQDKGYKVEQRRVSLKEVLDAIKGGSLTECFGTGTAAVISPVGELRKDSSIYRINNGETGKLSLTLYNELTGIQTGKLVDKFGWTEVVGD